MGSSIRQFLIQDSNFWREFHFCPQHSAKLLYCSRTLHPWELKALSCCCVPADHCMAPKKIGPCRGSFPRWHYNAASQKCEQFTFGGCRENLNNYLSQAECTNACAGSGISSPWLYIDLDFFNVPFVAFLWHVYMSIRICFRSNNVFSVADDPQWCLNVCCVNAVKSTPKTYC